MYKRQLEHDLGCTHHVTPMPTVSDSKRIEIAFDMCGYVRDTVTSYLELSKINTPLKPVFTPYLIDEETGAENEGLHSKVAMAVLAKLLYCARLARPDFMLAINLLSRNLTTWTVFHDRALLRLMSYAHYSANFMLRGYVGSDLPSLDLYPDADHAGCKKTSRSTSGIWLEISTGSESTFPIDWSSKRQGSVAFSTPEAEIVSLESALKDFGIPARSLMQVAAINKGLREGALPLSMLTETVTGVTPPINHKVPMTIFEDNTATIVIASKGRSPALRHLNKTHRISIMWVAEVVNDPSIKLTHCPTLEQKGDGFTKQLDRVKFQSMLQQLNIR